MARKKNEQPDADPTPDAPEEFRDDVAPEQPAPEAKAPTARYLVVVRHSPAPLKKLECVARDEADAERQYMAALRAKLGDKHSQAEEMVASGQKTVKRL